MSAGRVPHRCTARNMHWAAASMWRTSSVRRRGAASGGGTKGHIYQECSIFLPLFCFALWKKKFVIRAGPQLSDGRWPAGGSPCMCRICGEPEGWAVCVLVRATPTIKENRWRPRVREKNSEMENTVVNTFDWLAVLDEIKLWRVPQPIPKKQKTKKGKMAFTQKIQKEIKFTGMVPGKLEPFDLEKLSFSWSMQVFCVEPQKTCAFLRLCCMQKTCTDMKSLTLPSRKVPPKMEPVL